MKVKSKQQRDFKKTLEFIPNYLDIGPRGGSLPDGALPLGIAHVCGACFDVQHFLFLHTWEVCIAPCCVV